MLARAVINAIEYPPTCLWLRDDRQIATLGWVLLDETPSSHERGTRAVLGRERMKNRMSLAVVWHESRGKSAECLPDALILVQ